MFFKRLNFSSLITLLLFTIVYKQIFYSVMWFNLKIENYILKHETNSDREIFFITDQINIWKNESRQDSLIDNLKESNKAFEWQSNEVAFQHLVNLLKDDSSLIKRSIVKEKNYLLLDASSSISGVSYSINLQFDLMSSDVLYQEFTCYLVGLLSTLKNREKHLIDIIQAKDAELEEYRHEGVEIKRKGLITRPFDVEAFEKDLTMPESLGNSAIICETSVRNLLSRLPSCKKKNEKSTLSPVHLLNKLPVKKEAHVSEDSDDMCLEDSLEVQIVQKKRRKNVMSLKV